METSKNRATVHKTYVFTNATRTVQLTDFLLADHESHDVTRYSCSFQFMSAHSVQGRIPHLSLLSRDSSMRFFGLVFLVDLIDMGP